MVEAKQKVKNGKTFKNINFKLPPLAADAIPRPDIFTVDVA